MGHYFLDRQYAAAVREPYLKSLVSSLIATSSPTTAVSSSDVLLHRSGADPHRKLVPGPATLQ